MQTSSAMRNGDKRRGHQGCAGRSIEPDIDNSDFVDFYAKAGQAVYLAQQSLLSEDWAIESFTTKIRWEVLISLAPYK